MGLLKIPFEEVGHMTQYGAFIDKNNRAILHEIKNKIRPGQTNRKTDSETHGTGTGPPGSQQGSGMWAGCQR